MYLSSFPVLTLLACSAAVAAPTKHVSRQESSYAGYLITSFTDANPQIQMQLSQGNDATRFTAINGGEAVLQSTVGTKAVRDPFLATDSERKSWYIIATDLDIRVQGFSWDKATRTGSLSLVVWKSDNLIDWSEPELVEVEGPDAGMAWAPSAVWDGETSQFYVFWASRFFDSSDADHTGSPTTLDKIRWATTKDFTTFTPAQDYISLADTPVIDQEFQYLGQPGHFARFIKNETVSKIWQETTTDGLFGAWTRKAEYVSQDSPVEGPASYQDNLDPDLYHLLLDDYTQYVPYESGNIQDGTFEKSAYPQYPSGLKHGSVTQLTSTEYDAIRDRFGL